MKSTERPNIILLILDSARRDQVGLYNADYKWLTPHLNRLAESSLVLNDHYAAGCGSTPAHVSIFSGQHNARHGVVHNMSEMNSKINPFPNYLKKLGYTTFGHCMASFIPPAGYEDFFGFDQFVYPGKIGFKPPTTTFWGKAKNKTVQALRKNPELWNISKSTYRKLRGEANVIKQSARHFDGKVSLQFLLREIRKNTSNGVPYFAYSTLLHPHTPYFPPEWCIDAVFKKRKINPLAFKIHSNFHAWVNGDFGPAQDAINDLKDLYRAELLYADHLIGKFIEDLKKEKLLENTIFIVTADHGELLGEHGRINHGATIFEEIYRIPGLLNCPNLIRPGVRNELTSNLDLLPTLLDLLGEDLKNYPQKLDGLSIMQDIPKDRQLIIDSPPLVLPQRLKNYPNLLALDSYFFRGVRCSKYKYLWRSNGEEQLYQVNHAEIDSNNLALTHKTICNEMHNSLKNFYHSIDASFDIEGYPINMGTTAAKKMTDPIIIQELKNLGYL